MNLRRFIEIHNTEAPASFAAYIPNDIIILEGDAMEPIITEDGQEIQLESTSGGGVGGVGGGSLDLPFDFAIIRFNWGAEDGRDLDTRTSITNLNPSVNGQTVGWSRLGSVGANYLVWGGDNTGDYGPEAILVDYKKMTGDHPGASSVAIELAAYWYGARMLGNISIEFATYLGGVMEQSGNDFVNTGGILVQSLTVDRNIVSYQQNPAYAGDHAAILAYNFNNKQAQIY